MKLKLCFTFLIVVFITVSLWANKNEPIFLGILETHNTNWPISYKPNTLIFKPYVRVTFVLENQNWIPIDIVKKKKQILNMENNSFKPLDNSYFDKLFTTYYILFNMKNIGSITTINSSSLKYECAWRSILAIKENKIPHIGKLQTDFSETWNGEKTYRPLVVSNVPNYHDPMGWKPYIKKSTNNK